MMFVSHPHQLRRVGPTDRAAVIACAIHAPYLGIHTRRIVFAHVATPAAVLRVVVNVKEGLHVGADVVGAGANEGTVGALVLLTLGACDGTAENGEG